MKIREMTRGDGEETLRLFYETVRSVCAEDYTEAQISAWASPRGVREWTDSFFAEGRRALVAEEGGEIVGFADHARDGSPGRHYVHRDCQRQGIATALCDELEAGCGADRLTTHASITARPFFEHRGYRVLYAQTVERHGVTMQNFVMEKPNAVR